MMYLMVVVLVYILISINILPPPTYLYHIIIRYEYEGSWISGQRCGSGILTCVDEGVVVVLVVVFVYTYFIYPL